MNLYDASRKGAERFMRILYYLHDLQSKHLSDL
jgi:hypothetical protein